MIDTYTLERRAHLRLEVRVYTANIHTVRQIEAKLAKGHLNTSAVGVEARVKSECSTECAQPQRHV